METGKDSMVVSLLGFGKIGGFLGFPYIEHVTDVTGYSDRDPISYSVIKPMFMKILRDKKYILLTQLLLSIMRILIDLALTLNLNLKAFSKRLMAYIKPGAGVHGDKMHQILIGISKLDLDISLDKFYFFKIST